MKPKM